MNVSEMPQIVKVQWEIEKIPSIFCNFLFSFVLSVAEPWEPSEIM